MPLDDAAAAVPRGAAPSATLPLALVLLGAAVAALSWALGLFDRVPHWGKVVHGVEGFLVTALFALLLLGYRDAERFRLPSQLAVVAAIFAGWTVAGLWEVAAWLLDWGLGADFQKSNADVMTDLLWGVLAATLGGLTGTRLYGALGATRRARLAAFVRAAGAGPGRVLDRHGVLVIGLVVACIAALLAVLWVAGRGIPGWPNT